MKKFITIVIPAFITTSLFAGLIMIIFFMILVGTHKLHIKIPRTTTITLLTIP